MTKIDMNLVGIPVIDEKTLRTIAEAVNLWDEMTTNEDGDYADTVCEFDGSDELQALRDILILYGDPTKPKITGVMDVPEQPNNKFRPNDQNSR